MLNVEIGSEIDTELETSKNHRIVKLNCEIVYWKAKKMWKTRGLTSGSSIISTNLKAWRLQKSSWCAVWTKCAEGVSRQPSAVRSGGEGTRRAQAFTTILLSYWLLGRTWDRLIADFPLLPPRIPQIPLDISSTVKTYTIIYKIRNCWTRYYQIFIIDRVRQK